MKRLLLSLLAAVLVSTTAFGGPAQKKIATVTTTSAQAAIQFQSLGSYTNFHLLCSNFSVGSVQPVILQFGTGSGPTYDTTGANYVWSFTYTEDSSATTSTFGQGTLAQNGILVIGYPNGAGASGALGSLDLELFGLSGSVTKNVVWQGMGWWNGLANLTYGGGGSYLSATVVTALQLVPASGTWNSGATCTLYGWQT